MRRNIYQPRYAATPRRVSGIFSLMKQWSGSVINLILHSMIIFSLLYFFLSCMYRTIFIHNAYQKEMFELICVYADRFMSFIPLDFLIGFYVQQVVRRWWDMFTTLPYPDKIALKLTSFCSGKVEL